MSKATTKKVRECTNPLLFTWLKNAARNSSLKLYEHTHTVPTNITRVFYSCMLRALHSSLRLVITSCQVHVIVEAVLQNASVRVYKHPGFHMLKLKSTTGDIITS
jgi:hypothetical protein